MQEWELSAYVCLMGNPGDIWGKVDKKTGKCDWDALTDMAAKGWELVSVTAINGGMYGMTNQILYTFKRPKQKGKTDSTAT